GGDHLRTGLVHQGSAAARAGAVGRGSQRAARTGGLTRINPNGPGGQSPRPVRRYLDLGAHVRGRPEELPRVGPALRPRAGGLLADLLAHDGGAERRLGRVDVDRRAALLTGGQQERPLVVVLDEPDRDRHARPDHAVGPRRPADAGVLQDVLERDDPRLDLALLVLGRVVPAVLAQVPFLAGRLDLLRDIDAPRSRKVAKCG